MSKVQCKFEVTSKTLMKGNDQCKNVALIKMSAVKSEPFGKYTPCGEVNMTIQNDSVEPLFVVGQEYIVEFIPVEGVK